MKIVKLDSPQMVSWQPSEEFSIQFQADFLNSTHNLKWFLNKPFIQVFQKLEVHLLTKVLPASPNSSTTRSRLVQKCGSSSSILSRYMFKTLELLTIWFLKLLFHSSTTWSRTHKISSKLTKYSITKLQSIWCLASASISSKMEKHLVMRSLACALSLFWWLCLSTSVMELCPTSLK